MGHHSGMGTFGGRRAVAHASALLALSTTASLALAAGGCSAALDQAHSVQTKLNRIDEVTEATVATPSADTGAAIRVGYTGVATVRELARLVGAIDEVAADEDYPSYRLDLDPIDSDGDALVVDDTFPGSDAEDAVLGNWLAVTAALLGEVRYTVEPGHESIEVDSGAGVAHDVGEASRVGYGSPATTWTFENAGTTFVVSGRVSPTDVQLFQGVQRSVSSDVLPTPATTWRLERRSDHVLLDLDVTLPGQPVPPERLTVRRFGADVQRLVTAAVQATRVAGEPVWLRLLHRTPESEDVFGYWVSDERRVRGRDPLMRGWDRWLASVVDLRG